jgi:hypothetical protein
MLASPGRYLTRSNYLFKPYFRIKKYNMKKVFFAILAISMLSASLAYAGKGKQAKKVAAKKTECPKDCPRSGCGH